mmetsp:Transcript_10768/g.30847  ORF Transcript_10768/g.30847 Transcript_10768/m.30847 type:complete len:242 (-) Transcript_10768:734-1459(-)
MRLQEHPLQNDAPKVPRLRTRIGSALFPFQQARSQSHPARWIPRRRTPRHAKIERGRAGQMSDSAHQANQGCRHEPASSFGDHPHHPAASRGGRLLQRLVHANEELVRRLCVGGNPPQQLLAHLRFAEQDAASRRSSVPHRVLQEEHGEDGPGRRENSHRQRMRRLRNLQRAADGPRGELMLRCGILPSLRHRFHVAGARECQPQRNQLPQLQCSVLDRSEPSIVGCCGRRHADRGQRRGR